MIKSIKELGLIEWKNSDGVVLSEALRAVEYAPNVPGHYPVILFLHGQGERGNDLSLLERTEIPQLFKGSFECPYIVLCPQMPVSYGSSWNKPIGEKVMAFLKTYNAPSYHITGLSMGGIGTANFLSYFSKKNQEVRNTALKPGELLHVWFSSAGIVCGTINDGAHEELKRIPARCWHGSNDATVRASDVQKDIPTLQAYGADIDLIMLPGVAHNAWDYAYAPGYPNNYWTWLAEKISRREVVTSWHVVNGDTLIIKTDNSVYSLPVTKVK